MTNDQISKATNEQNGTGHSETPSKPVKPKSKLCAYFWWLFGGIFGAHHIYLGRDDHAIVWFCTLGGYFGIGWLRDIYKIPTYVADANNQPEYIEWFKQQVRTHKTPPFCTVRFLGSSVVSYLFGQLVDMAIPEDEVYGINFRPLIIFIPLGVTVGVWLVGNIGREQGSIWIPLIIAYLCYPLLYYIGYESQWLGTMVLATTLGFDAFAKRYRLRPKKKRTTFQRIRLFTFAILIYTSLWFSYFYFNATITDSEGEEIKLSEAIKHFLTSPIWLEFKTSLNNSWRYARHNGFWATWSRIIDLTDPRGEINAYKVLDLSQTASQSEVTAKWRALSRENHPDKVKGSEEDRQKAQERFMEIQEAYEILSSAKNRRTRRNRREG